MNCSKTVILSVKAGSSKYLAIILVVLMHFPFVGFAQEKGGADSLVRLVEAVSAHLIEIDSISYRKVVGPATFLHNDTYLKCDTALWNVNTNIIDAVGNVQIIQENTLLTSDRIEYVVAENLAKFRGSLVQLLDRDGNVLNTSHLDYNTKDSIASFHAGAALRNNDGNLIESINGMYYAKDKLFTFRDSVQMFTDSVFIVSSRVDYHTDTDVAVFNSQTVAWKDDNMLYANSGNFNRRSNLFTFDRDGYVLTREQELWADLLKYSRNTGYAELYDNVQILDTVQTSICLADKVTYRPDPMLIELTDKPAVALYSVENDVPDTLFLRGDRILYSTRRMYEVDSSAIKLANERLSLSAVDPIAIHDQERRKARSGGGLQQVAPIKGKMGEKALLEGPGLENKVEAVPDTIGKQMDSTLPAAVPAVQEKDTTEVIFVDIFHNVKFYRSDVQGTCDSLVYTGLDSMARFYTRPVMWYDGVNQFAADSIQAHLKDGQLHKINLLSEAFITTQEDSVHFNQIKSTEMAAYFSNNELFRFDALGGVSAVFYIEEDSTITLMDQEECKMMTVKIKDNQVQRTRSIGEIKQNVFPVYNLPIEKQRLRGFEWRGAERPLSRFEITDRKIKPSLRKEMVSRPLPGFRYTFKYFPELYDSIIGYRDISIVR